MKQSLKYAYHALVPTRIRYPMGYARRAGLDSWRRLRTAGALPPRRLLQKVQMTPWVDEYLRVGEKSWRSISQALYAADADPSADLKALDFGCGLGRTLRFCVQDTSLRWELAGCDVDEALVAWSRDAFQPARAGRRVDVRRNETRPPLPWEDGAFDVVWTVSVFTHFDAAAQAAWAAELGRILRPGGLAAVTTMGPHAFGGFANLDTPERRAAFLEDGFLFHPGGDTFNANGAFHTEDAVRRIFQADFELLRWTEGGLDGFQDLSVLRRLGG